jgi:hypothetical protein
MSTKKPEDHLGGLIHFHKSSTSNDEFAKSVQVFLRQLRELNGETSNLNHQWLHLLDKVRGEKPAGAAFGSLDSWRSLLDKVRGENPATSASTPVRSSWLSSHAVRLATQDALATFTEVRDRLVSQLATSSHQLPKERSEYKELRSSTVKVAAFLLSRSEPGWSVAPISAPRIAQELELSERTVRYALKELRDGRFMRLIGSPGRPSRYDLSPLVKMLEQLDARRAA